MADLAGCVGYTEGTTSANLHCVATVESTFSNAFEINGTSGYANEFGGNFAEFNNSAIGFDGLLGASAWDGTSEPTVNGITVSAIKAAYGDTIAANI